MLFGLFGSGDHFESDKEIQEKIVTLSEREKNAMKEYTRNYSEILIKNADEEMYREKEGWSLWGPNYKEYPKCPISGLEMENLLFLYTFPRQHS